MSTASVVVQNTIFTFMLDGEELERYLFVTVRTRFVTTRNSIGFARKKAQTISFIERGFEKLGLSHQTVGFSWCSYIVKSCSPWEFFSRRRARRL